MVDFVSASQIKTWMLCKQLYYLTYVEGIKQYVDPYTITGSALHKAIQSYYKDDENVFFSYYRYFTELIKDAIDKKLLKNVHKVHLAQKRGVSHLTKLKLTRFTPSETELEFLLPFGDTKMKGFIDLIDGKNIIDHKSSSRLPTATQRAEDPQFIIYAWAYNEIFGHMPEHVYWHHLEDGELYECDVLTNFEAKMKKIEQVVQEMGQWTSGDYPKKTRDGFCEKVCDHFQRCYG